MANLYLIPCPIGENVPKEVLPPSTIETIHTLDYFIVENEKSARRFLRAAEHPKAIRELHFEVLNKHTLPEDISSFLQPIKDDHSIGIISEAGCPGVADPGASVVALAHQKNIQVVPLIGPSSILLALMASGFNGQSFSFVGYLPKDKGELKNKLKTLESISKQYNQTQIFIETPFRNNQLLENLKQYCSNNTKVCVAANINQANETIFSGTIKQLKNKNLNLHKIPAVFCLIA